jgi:hypothetical protein
LIVHNVSEPIVPGSSHLEVEIAIAKLEKYKLPGSIQILADLIQAGGETLLSEHGEAGWEESIGWIGPVQDRDK